MDTKRTQRNDNGDIVVPAYWCLLHEQVHEGLTDDFSEHHHVQMRPLAFKPYPMDQADNDDHDPAQWSDLGCYLAGVPR